MADIEVENIEGIEVNENIEVELTPTGKVTATFEFNTPGASFSFARPSADVTLK